MAIVLSDVPALRPEAALRVYPLRAHRGGVQDRRRRCGAVNRPRPSVRHAGNRGPARDAHAVPDRRGRRRADPALTLGSRRLRGLLTLRTAARATPGAY